MKQRFEVIFFLYFVLHICAKLPKTNWINVCWCECFWTNFYWL